MQIVAAPDKFRGTASATEVAAAIADAVEESGNRCVELPLADGGEGTLEVLGGGNRFSVVTGPLGEPLIAEWRLEDHAAVIEMAKASGLSLAGGGDRNDPMAATSLGTGELIDEAIRAGARRIILGLGGSACTDGGSGAVDVIARWAPFGGDHGIDIAVATDVRTTFVEAAAVFAPQKGADPRQVAELTDRLVKIAQAYRTRFGVDIRQVPGSGAAGGLAGGIAALGGRIVDGFDLVADKVGLDATLARAALVITGEGKLDASSMQGKVVGGVISRARRAGVMAAVIAGQVDPAVKLGIPVVDLAETFGMTCAVRETVACIREATRAVIK
jgi:glycerate 2-kinase